MFLAIPIFVRVGRAAQVVWTLVSDRRTARRLPWRYLGRRATRDLRMVIQVAGIVAATVAYPVAFLMPEVARSPTIIAAAGFWLLAAIGPSLERILLRAQRTR